MLYFLGPVRRLVQQHVSPQEFCLVSELGFLFHMLNQVPGTNCQASNFLRAFRTIPQASGLGLILDVDAAEPDATVMIGKLQAWTRFMLAQLELSTRETPINPTRLSNAKGGKGGKGSGPRHGGKNRGRKRAANDAQCLFGSYFSLESTCQVCHNTTNREDDKMVIELEAPSGDLDDEALRSYSFGALLRDSLCRVHFAKAFCKTEKCKDYKTARHVRRVNELPDVLALNCNTDKPAERAFWHRKVSSFSERPSKPTMDPITTPTKNAPGAGEADESGGAAAAAAAAPAADSDASERSRLDPVLGEVPVGTWLPHQIKVKVVPGGDVEVVEVMEPPEAEGATILTDDEDGIAYELVASVCHINDSTGACNFVSHIKVRAPSSCLAKCPPPDPLLGRSQKSTTNSKRAFRTRRGTSLMISPSARPRLRAR